ncbi:MAG: beta-propeller fold lactonase family protein [Terracidiphilus sp.]
MKIGKWAWLLAATAFLSGCGNFWQPPSGTSSTTTTTSTASSGVFYVADQATDQIAAYSIVSGVLTPVSGSPYTIPGPSAPLALAVAPNGSFLYVGTANGIFLYTIGSGGALTVGNSGSSISGEPAAAMQVDSTDSWLVAAFPAAGGVALEAIAISPTTGLVASLASPSVTLSGTTVFQLAISPDNDNMFVALGSGGTEKVAFNSGSGTPFVSEKNIPVANSAGAAVSVAVDPQNRMVYIGETAATPAPNSGGVRAFNYSTMTEISGSPYVSGGLAPYAILPLSSGSYVYVANRTVSGSSDGNIAGFAVATTGSTYSLTALSDTAAAGIDPVSMAADPDGNYLFVVDSGGSPDLEAYTFDSTTAGKLDSALTGATGTDPAQASAIAVTP